MKNRPKAVCSFFDRESAHVRIWALWFITGSSVTLSKKDGS